MLIDYLFDGEEGVYVVNFNENNIVKFLKLLHKR